MQQDSGLVLDHRELPGYIPAAGPGLSTPLTAGNPHRMARRVGCCPREVGPAGAHMSC